MRVIKSVLAVLYILVCVGAFLYAYGYREWAQQEEQRILEREQGLQAWLEQVGEARK